MGEIMKATCPCGYTEDFYLGSGILSANLQVIGTMFNESVLKEIQAWLNANKPQTVRSEYALACCDNCGCLAGMSKVTFLAAKTEKEFYNTCGCGGTYRVLGNGFEKNTPCPDCKKTLKFEEQGRWD
jgi:hypothetical protein